MADARDLKCIGKTLRSWKLSILLRKLPLNVSGVSCPRNLSSVDSMFLGLLRQAQHFMRFTVGETQ
jgi:hypothetical protein